MLQFDLDQIDTARIGRMGELIVELELLARGWIVGNFNATTANSAGWDLFATRGRRTVKIRVKAKRPGVAAFRWSAKADGSIFLGLEPGADDDFVGAVSFEKDGSAAVYIVPTAVVDTDLQGNHGSWLSGAKRDGGVRQDTSMRHLYLDDRQDLGPAHGYAVRWGAHRAAWQMLERPSLGRAGA